MKLLALLLVSLSLCAQQVAPSTPRTVASDTMKDLSGQALVGDITLTLNDPQYIFVRRVPATAGVFSVSLYPGTYSVVIHSSTFGIDRSETWVVPNSGSVQTLSDVGSPSANITGGGSGTFVTLSGDASSTSTGGATVVNGLKGVPFCTGYTPTEGQFVEWTALSTPNPCYTAAVGGSGSGVSLVLDTGAANAYTSAVGGAMLADGLIINLRTLHANSGASTFAYNAGTARAIVDQAGNVLVSGMIPVGNVLLQYQASGTTWRLLQPNLGTAAFSASSVFQLALTNYSTISGLTGYPSTFPPFLPGASTPGGVDSYTCSSGHISAINTDGTVTCSADSGGGGTRTWNYMFQGVNYGGVLVFSGNIPSANAPTAKLNSGANLAVLDFTQGTSNQTWYGAWQMPPSYPANGTISYSISSMCDPANCDSTHAANVYISLACSGTTARSDSTSYTELTAPIAITNSASGYQTVTTGTITPAAGTPTLPACATTNRATIKLRVDTTDALHSGANPLTGSFQLVAVSFYVQGQI